MIAEYLVVFFGEIDKHQPSGNHAITFRYGQLYILVGMGDVRVRVPVESLDPDPARAAESVINVWRSMTDSEMEMAMEECR